MSGVIFGHDHSENRIKSHIPRICDALEIKPHVRWDVIDLRYGSIYCSFETKPEADSWIAAVKPFPAHVSLFHEYPDIADNYGAWQTAVARLAAFGFLLSISCKMDEVEGVYWLARLRCIDGGTRGEHIGSGNDPLAATCYAAVALLDAAEKEGWSLRPSGQTAYPKLPYWA